MRSHSRALPFFPFLVACVLAVAFPGPGWSQAPDAGGGGGKGLPVATIAVVQDGPGPYSEKLVGEVQRELEPLVAGKHEVKYKRNFFREAGWDPARARLAFAAGNRNLLFRVGVARGFWRAALASGSGFAWGSGARELASDGRLWRSGSA